MSDREIGIAFIAFTLGWAIAHLTMIAITLHVWRIKESNKEG